MDFEILLLVLTILLTSLTTGLFFDYAVAVNWGLNKLKDEEYVHAMQSINRVIQNPLFFTAFFMPVLLLPLVTFLYGGPVGSARFLLFIGATVAYIFGTFGTTMAKNVPLNNQLDTVPDSASSKEISQARTQFEHPWNRLNAVRTVTGMVAVILLSWGALL
jgi:uncharacterized membrane protein